LSVTLTSHGQQGFGDAQDFFRPSAAADEGDDGAPPPRPNTLTVDVCLTGVIFTAYLALHYFRKTPSRPGKLILQSSVNGLWPNSRLILYSAAKHGVRLAFVLFFPLLHIQVTYY
jgi:15-hydroxyprostaglandin dehydrogenase (NAD)